MIFKSTFGCSRIWDSLILHVKIWMSTQVWRFAYEENSLKYVLESEIATFPGFNPLGEGRHNSVESIVSDMKVGAVIILANFNIIDSSATVRAAGKVKDIRNDSIYVEWKKIIPSLSLHPHKIGAKQWEKESVFLINPQRVRDFKLDRLIKKCFPVSL